MQRRITTITITGALLAIASFAPHANACKIPGRSPLGAAIVMPPSMFPPAGAADPAGGAGTSIVGLWHVTFSSGGGVVDEAFDAWHSDGTEILNDFTDPIEDNVCLGVWTQTGPGTYKLKHPSWTFDGNGNLTGTAWIFETVTLGSGGNGYDGPYSIAFFDTMGSPVGTYTGTVKAYRITP